MTVKNVWTVRAVTAGTDLKGTLTNVYNVAGGNAADLKTLLEGTKGSYTAAGTTCSVKNAVKEVFYEFEY